MPIEARQDFKFWLNKEGFYHRIDGPAVIFSDGETSWCVNGTQYGNKKLWDEARQPFLLKRVYFLREKIIALQKLIEIPESWDEVYYSHKGSFLTLLRKLC